MIIIQEQHYNFVHFKLFLMDAPLYVTTGIYIQRFLPVCNLIFCFGVTTSNINVLFKYSQKIRRLQYP
jgi:hypothetical protein